MTPGVHEIWRRDPDGTMSFFCDRSRMATALISTGVSVGIR
jgi:hypothetical protein